MIILPLFFNQTIWRSPGVLYIQLFFYAVVVLQIAEGNVEELERFLLSIQDCVSRIEQGTASGNDRNLEYLHDSLEGFGVLLYVYVTILDILAGNDCKVCRVFSTPAEKKSRLPQKKNSRLGQKNSGVSKTDSRLQEIILNSLQKFSTGLKKKLASKK